MLGGIFYLTTYAVIFFGGLWLSLQASTDLGNVVGVLTTIFLIGMVAKTEPGS